MKRLDSLSHLGMTMIMPVLLRQEHTRWLG
jgi:hypothetical protein